MIKQVIILVLLASAAGAEVLTNEKIISMVSAGVGAETIEALVNGASECSFDTRTEALIALTNAKVPERVLKAIVAKTCTATVTAAAAQQTMDSTASIESDELVRLPSSAARGLEGFIRIDKTGITFCCRGNYYYAQSARGMCGDSFKLPLDQVKAQYLYDHEGENPMWSVVTVADIRYQFLTQPEASALGRQKYSDFVTRAFATLAKLRPDMPSAQLAPKEYNRLYKLTEPSFEGHSFCDEQWNVVVK